MNARPISWTAKGAGILIALTLQVATAAAQEPPRYQGRSLTEVLQALQAQGLRIVFSSATVPRDSRVLTEPRAAAPRQQLDELLAPHGLEIREGPGGTLQVVRAQVPVKKSRPPARGANEGRVVDAPAPPPRKYSEYVYVTQRPPSSNRSRGRIRDDRRPQRVRAVARRSLRGSGPCDPGVATRVGHRRLQQRFRGTGQSFPAGQRGGGWRLGGWLRHTAYGRAATGSLTMLSGQVLEGAALRTGAYPRRNGDRLGPELDLTLREGSRTDFALRGAIGGSHVSARRRGSVGTEGLDGRGERLVARGRTTELPRMAARTVRVARGRRSVSPMDWPKWCSTCVPRSSSH